MGMTADRVGGMDCEQAKARCWIEVDLDTVASNYREARRICGEGVRVIPVLKANAYGLGAARLSRLLCEAGAGLFAVAEPGEALALRRACGADVLVLGRTAPLEMEAAIRAGVILTAYDLRQTEALNDEIGRAHV